MNSGAMENCGKYFGKRMNCFTLVELLIAKVFLKLVR